jgi:hypothetical protein
LCTVGRDVDEGEGLEKALALLELRLVGLLGPLINKMWPSVLPLCIIIV